MTLLSPATSTTAGQGGATTISAIDSDIIRSHILARLDGQSLASAASTSSQLNALSADQKLWQDICAATWPSTADPSVHRLISTFPDGHRSFFADAFPRVHHRRSPPESNPETSSSAAKLISAVDVYYKDHLVFSKIQEKTMDAWFKCIPFRISLIKDPFPIPIPYSETDNDCVKQIEENLTLSWILIDPALKRAANFSTLRPVSVYRNWLIRTIEAKFAVVMDGDRRQAASEIVQCVIMVKCEGKEGRDVEVRELSMEMEDMEGKVPNGWVCAEIMQEAMEKGERKKMDENEGKKRYREYLGMRREKVRREVRREKVLNMASIAIWVSIFMVFWWFVLFR